MSASVADFTVDIAKNAGSVLMEYFGTDLVHNIKTTEDDFYTEADLAAEKSVITAIQKEFPADAILSEEAGFLGSADAEYTWVIDPLDGTYNFAHGNKEFGVMISRTQKGTQVCSVLYNPAKDELAVAEQDATTVDGGPPRETQQVSITEANFAVSHVQTDPGHNLMNEITAELQKLQVGTESVHSAIGNTFALLKGRKDCWIMNLGYEWDIAPTMHILQAAGMRARTIDNNEVDWTVNNNMYIVAEPTLLEVTRQLAVQAQASLS